MGDEVLSKIPLFAGLSPDERADLGGLLKTRQYQAQAPVFWIGENGTEFYIVQIGNARINIFGDSGVDILSPDGFNTETRNFNSVCVVKKVANNVWDLFGDLAPFLGEPVNNGATWKGDSSNPSLGNGTESYTAYRDNDHIVARGKITMGSTTTFGSGDWYVQLAGAQNVNAVMNAYGVALIFDQSAGQLIPCACFIASGTNKIYFIAPSTTGQVDSATPMTWAQNDTIEFHIRYPV